MKSIKIFLSNMTFSKKIFIALTPLITVLMSIKLMLLGLFFLIFIDLITGINKTLYLKNIRFNPFNKMFWKSIKSYLLRQTWRKTYEYGLGIITIAVIETMVIGATPITLLAKTFTITELAVVFPAGVEVWSIYENFEAVSGNNVLKKLSDILPTPLKKIFSSGKHNDDV